ncbi:MAG: polysaccharide biosynthesis tyrosine autokinase [Terriglobia bacterium]|jgi:capsular exopolysaccharide synthesis family protein
MAENDKLMPTNGVPPDRPAYSGYPVLDVEASRPDAYSFHTYWEILRKRRGTVFTVAFIITILVTLVVFRMKPVYRATARMEVQAETPQLQTLNELNPSAAADAAFLQTQVDLLQNNNLAWETIQQLGLAAGSPELSAGGKGGPASTDRSPSATQSSLIRAFRKHLHVELLNESRLVEVSFESVDPSLAARVANALVKNYVESSFRSKYETTRQASAWMEQQLDELKAKVEKSQQALVDYERENSIADVGDKENVVGQRLGDLSKDLTAAQTDRANKESVYDSVQSNKAEAAIIANDALLQQLDSKYADLKTQYAATTSHYGPNFYRVKELRNQINEVESLMDRERKLIIERIGSDYRTALRREQLLSREVAQQRAEVEKLNQLLIQYTILKGEFETNQQLYNDLLKRLKDATVSVSLRATNVRLADEALIPSIPIRPDKPLDIAVGLLVGLILGVTLAFIRESLDRTIKTAEDIESEITVPTLAVIPLGTTSRGRYGRYFPYGARKAAGNGNLALAVLSAPGSQMAESFRVLRTSILLSSAPQPPQVLLVTSAHPSEGKTFASVNLALALAQRGRRVLLVDSDLRKPNVLKALGLSDGAGPGLSSFLMGEHDIEQALQAFTAAPNLWLLPPGPIPPNPAELLSSPAMEGLVRDLRQRFEHIVFDSPPLLLVTDGILLSALADGVVLVVESGTTSRGALNRVRRILDRAGANTLGAVLNKLEDRADGYYSSRYRYYNYYYSRDHSASKVAEAASSNDQPPTLTPR